jgi:DNA-binding response OmpR family regulator
MFLSAAAYETDKQAAMDSGAQCYLVKPADIQRLSFEIDALILGSGNRNAAERSDLSLSAADPTMKITAQKPDDRATKGLLAP